MSKQELKDQIASFESYVNDMPLVIDLCRMCRVYKDNNDSYEYTVKNKDGDFVDGRCLSCCWFYDSKFEVQI
jgi:hypothetical protein